MITPLSQILVETHSGRSHDFKTRCGYLLFFFTQEIHLFLVLGKHAGVFHSSWGAPRPGSQHPNTWGQGLRVATLRQHTQTSRKRSLSRAAGSPGWSGEQRNKETSDLSRKSLEPEPRGYLETLSQSSIPQRARKLTNKQNIGARNGDSHFQMIDHRK